MRKRTWVRNAVVAGGALLGLATAARDAEAQVTWRFSVPVNLQSIPAVVIQGKVQCKVRNTAVSGTAALTGETVFNIPASRSYQQTVVVDVGTEIPDHAPGATERQECMLWLLGPGTSGGSEWTVPTETNSQTWARPRPGEPFDYYWFVILP